MSQQLIHTLLVQLTVSHDTIVGTWRRIGAHLYNARTASGLSLRQVGDQCGIDHAHLSHLERGTKRADTVTIRRLADYLEPSPMILPNTQVDHIRVVEVALKNLGCSLDDFAPQQRKEFTAIAGELLRIDSDQ